MKDGKLSIQILPDAPYGEVVDSIADALEAGVLLENNLSDGFQVSDLLAALQIQPKVQEIVNDIPQFLAEFTKLNGFTAESAVLEARQRVIGGKEKVGPVNSFIIKLLYVAAKNYQFAISTYQGGQAQFMLWQSLLNGGEIFAGEVKPVES